MNRGSALRSTHGWTQYSFDYLRLSVVKDNIAEAIRYVAEVAWRRRRLLLLPFLLLLPLSIVASYVLPRSFASRALLVMQEQGADNPLIKAQSTNERIRDRAPGLQALLKSDRVLLNAAREILGERMPTNPREIALLLKSLDQQLTFEMIGTDFLELQLKDGNPVGLGRKLEIITSRFLESMLSPDQDAVSATQLLLEKRREELVTAEKALARFKEQLGERSVATITANQQRISELTGSSDRIARDIAATTTDIEALADTVGLPPDARNAPMIESIMQAAGAELAAAERRGPTGVKAAEAARSRLVTLRRIQAQENRRVELERDLAIARNAAVLQSQAPADPRSPEAQLRRLEREVADAKQVFDTYSRRFPAGSTARSSLQVLRAPERIRVIDAPRDPEFPLTSRLKYILAGLVGALMLSLGLALGAEAFEQRVRNAREFEDIVGAPVVARLPSAMMQQAGSDSARQEQPVAPRNQWSTPDNDVTNHGAPNKPRQSAA